MSLKKLIIKNRLRLTLLALIILLAASGLNAQTNVTSPMTGTPAAGNYYSYSTITLSPTFSFTAGAGSSLQLYIASADCQLLGTAASVNQNYIITSIPRTPMNTFSTAGKSTCDLMQTVQYFDGLGRSIQTVQVKGSPLGNDLVQPAAYDQFGREAVKYLPYAITTGNSDGSYKTNALTAGAGVLQYYNPTGNGISGSQQGNGIVINPFPYAVTGFEPSPLNRVTEQGAPGASWQPVTGATTGHTNKIVYATNNYITLIDTTHSYLAVMYSATINADQSRSLTSYGYYPANQLYVTISRNENWKSGKGGTTEEYKDLDGHVVLKRTFNYKSGATPAMQILSTYYVYDDLGNLAFVLPPLANGDSTTPPLQTTLDNLCYQYRYDYRNRLCQKKLPGKGWEYIVYNSLDHPVLSQDANQRAANQWTVIKYDVLGRTIITGLWNAGAVISLSTLQASIYAAAQWDTRDVANNTAANPTGYIISSYPALSAILTVNYYDNYTAPGLPSKYSSPAGASTATTGLLTATKTAVLNTITNTTPDMLWTAQYYDGLGRGIQTYSQHYLGGTANLNPAYNYDVVADTYDFTNEITGATRSHYNFSNAASSPIVTVANTFVYDHMGRKKQTFETINGGINVLLLQTDYNEIGQVMTKHLHSETGGSPFLQDIPYTYNERGWLGTAGNGGNLFSFTLKYNMPDAGGQQYNGNIAEMIYSKTGSGNITDYYSYDQLNRLTNAVSGDNLSEQLSYDFNGNINSLTRGAQSYSALAYTYLNGGLSNQLGTVSGTGFTGRSYGYDPNGNATSDGMGRTLTYNLLNLPQNVSQPNNSNSTLATYTYDAAGQKLKNMGSDGYWDYIGGIVYNGTTAASETIQFMPTEEGRAVLQSGVWRYEYNLKDQLGNVRVSFDKDPTTGTARRIQEDEYYAFGLRNPFYNFSNNNRYLYNGKEVQTDLTNQYDYGARFYDPVIARWNTIDPLAEVSRRWSPYNYVENNPIRLIDPDGMTDYYNLNGKPVKHVDDGSSEKQMVLTSSEKASQVDKALANSEVVAVPTNEALSKMDDAYQKTEETGHESGFVVATDGSTSSTIVSPSNSEIKLGAGYDELANTGKAGSYDVHVHPLGPDAEGKYGAAVPSGTNGGTPGETGDTDKYGKNGENKPSVVLGYQVNQTTITKDITTNGDPLSRTTAPTPTKQIGFYNAKGQIGGPIDYNKFKKAVQQINQPKKDQN